MIKILKAIAPKSFNNGLEKCNQLGKKLVKTSKIDNFLDIGCGNGKLTLEFAQLLNAKSIYGIEFTDESIEISKKNGINCIKGDLNNEWSLESNYFDIILSSQNIEHIHNTRKYLEECYRCLKPGGQLIILTENLSSTINIFALLFGWQPFSTTNINGWSLGNPLIWHIDEKKDDFFIEKYQKTTISGTVGHVRVLAFRGLHDLLKKVGFKDIRIYSKGYLPFWSYLSDLLCKIDKIHGHFLVVSCFK